MTITCSRCGKQWERDPALAVRCPVCNAPEGSCCRRPSGHSCEIHMARDREALKRGLIEKCPGARGRKR